MISVSETHSLKAYIRGSKRITTIASAALMFILLLSFFTLRPVYIIPEKSRTNAATGTATASESSITLASTNTDTSVVLTPGAGFTLSTASNTSSYDVTTNNYTGYTITLTSEDNDKTLVHTVDNTKVISSITTPIAETDFVSTTSGLMNHFGIKPNKYYDTENNTTIDNTVSSTILPAPGTTGLILDKTTSSNSTANNYSIALGAMVDGTIPAGDYTRDTILTVIPNPIYYTINYNKNTDDTVTNLPTSQSANTTETSITLSSLVPERTGYDFIGWCNTTTTTANNTDSCAGTIYNPEGEGTDLTYGIDQTTANTITLRAMWRIKIYMQDITPDTCPTTRTPVYDSRDDKRYYIQKITYGSTTKCWMTSSLNLAGGTALYSDDSNVDVSHPRSGNEPFWTLPVSSPDGFDNASVANVYNTGSTTCGENSPCYSYYNYPAATAGTNPGPGDSVYDICPRGWRLPTQTEYADLIETYTTGSALVTDPWFGEYGGDYHESAPSSGGTYGYYWSSTVFYPTAAYRLDYTNARIHTFLINKSFGNLVRCVADRTIPVTAAKANGASGIVVDGVTYEGTLIRLAPGIYTISGVFNSGYEFASWAASGGIIVGSTLSNSTTLTVTSAGTLTLRGKQKVYMQNITPDTCPTTRTLVYDARDEKQYYVQKITYGSTTKCWMTTNLDLAGGTALYSNTSNVPDGHPSTGSTPYYTLPASRTSADGGVTLDGGFNDNAVADVYNSGSTTCGNNSPCYSYYSYTAATAGTNPSSGDAQYDICPKGWRLPTQTELTALMTTYTTGATLTAAPFNGVYTGYYYYGSFFNGGSSGYYWSSTADDVSHTHRLLFYSSTADVTNDSKYLGYPVRCVADRSVPVTLVMDSGASGIMIYGTTYTDGTIRLNPGTYAISGIFDSDYTFDGWTVSGGVTVDSASSSSTVLTVTSAGTLTLSSKKLYMQDITPETCPTTATTAYDSRDEKAYTIQKLADNKCWLLDNLALDLTDADVLSNLSESNTNASATSLTSLRSGNRAAGDQYATAGVVSWTSSYSNSAPLIATSGTGNNGDWTKDTTISYAMSQPGTGNIGVYYNYCAASAGSYCYGNGVSEGTSSGNATEDICPKGWRMPTGGSSGEYQALYTAYSSDGAAFVNALRTPLSGYFYISSASYQNSYGYFWSSTRNSKSAMYVLYVSTSSVNPQNFASRSLGLSVRCVLDPPVSYTIAYNKNTNDTVSNMPTTQTGMANSIQTPAVSANTPTRSGYAFLGWCTTQPATSNNIDSCSGATHFPGSQFTMAGNSSITLYAVWAAYSSLPTIQSITTSTCSASPMLVKDSRDYEVYTIQRLADGKCWLLDNLALDLTNTTVKNDLSASNTNASATTLNYLKNGGGTTSDQYATAGVANWTSSYSYSAPLINTASKDTPVSYAMGQSGTGKIGLYYNYCAATAGSYCYGDGTSPGTPSGDATEDICPKGWRMPTGGSSGEYQSLYTAYSSDKAAFVNALRTPLSGYFDNGSVNNQGSGGDFWSSTRNGNSFVYYLNVTTSYVYTQNSSSRIRGNPVRCVLQ